MESDVNATWQEQDGHAFWITHFGLSMCVRLDRTRGQFSPRLDRHEQPLTLEAGVSVRAGNDDVREQQ